MFNYREVETMAEELNPNPSSEPKQRAPMASRIQSPTSPFFLSSNDDQLERAEARAARAAATRRKLIAATAPSTSSDPCLDKEQIAELFQNCIKLASENKINQKNTWNLRLIDHLSEIVKVKVEDDVETNFQKASCTLEAGVKIYSMRVDSVHSEAYKVLGGINRAGREDEQETTVEGDDIKSGQEEGCPKKELGKKVYGLLIDCIAAFTVDPLYHQTSAQFDEGGTKGLLLNNLGVYGGCRVIFDSLETPGKYMSCSTHGDVSDMIDVSFARGMLHVFTVILITFKCAEIAKCSSIHFLVIFTEYIEQMVINMPTKDDISPTLRDIVDQFDEDNQRPPDILFVGQKAVRHVDVADNDQAEFDGNTFENCGAWSFDHDDQESVVDERSNCTDPIFPSHHEEDDPYTFHEPDIDDRFEKVAGFLFLGLGCTSKQNSWAGPDHWKYRKAKGPEDAPVVESGSPLTAKRPKNKKQAEIDIDLTKFLDKEMSDIFAPPKNPKLLLLPANKLPCNTTLPEDCHYQPEDLVMLFLLPNIMCLGRRGINLSNDSRQQSHDFGPLPSWDNESVLNGQFDDGNIHSDVEDSSTLVSQPRQVNKIEVQYDKTSKQVDVNTLKETLWDHIQVSAQSPEKEQEGALSFRHLVATFPNDCRAAATKDISPHLCFICLLHLANEHGLKICDCPCLDDLQIYFPLCQNTGGVI
ncbi:hypothetical protein HHK36_023886 [Tetracentron sinense]|uniref:Condensin complex subunit 2 n=1 Tax=Tetracentron sinense TaxID=13715 RepID=A0A834YNY3_TETSI|nr:hypothetical protein HHK36_023886 [Tetracentron sinense]